MNAEFQLVFLVLAAFLSAAFVTGNAIPPSKSTHHGLYEPTDDVVELNATNLHSFIYNRTYASYVEFYNAFCGHCRKFAPKWKAFATDLLDWRDVVAIGAIDCSADDNNDLCREFEIMAYPTIRYIPPNYKKSGNRPLGIDVDQQDPDQLKEKLIVLLKNETSPPVHWPVLSALEENSIANLFIGTSDIEQFIFLIYPTENSSIGYQVSLDLHSIKQIQIRQVDSSPVAMNLELNERPGLYVVNRDLELTLLPLVQFDRNLIRSTIRKFIHNRFSALPTLHFERKRVTTSNPDVDEMANGADAAERDKKVREVLKMIQSMKGLVFEADLELALQTTLFNEIPRYSEISGERLVALQRYISVLNRYSFLDDKQRGFLKELESYVMSSEEIKGEYFEAKVKRLKIKYQPIFTATRWVGCQSSAPHLRGFTCGLWELFHQLTVRAADMEESHDPLEVLQAIHEYVKFFFGCSQCSLHFQEMAKSNDIWGVKNKDDAVLWLWSAHNQVNKRLQGDSTEDPMFPKQQYPDIDMCPECRRKAIYNHSQEMEWDKQEVLNFMKRIYSPVNLSKFGEQPIDPALSYAPAAALRAQRTIGRAFSDIDLRVGIFLYAFCIGMLILAVRMFIRKRSYRKKPFYDHAVA